MSVADKFLSSGFSHWLNSVPGRIFRFCAGVFFLLLAILFWNSWLGIFSLIWFIFPLSAGALDVCYISAAVGGPFTGKKIRQHSSYRANSRS